ncbi:hypothetical protein CUJ83_01885 [Methanocella sp. CWC-04]|uniref:Uncharacterized protein n=1 Tax=Methanooceanicella nereidis TaxID=2052831 RepID=A0AAP2W413_9EURY|nr:hypothetical protein [Methanocella sp. CWC-04]MCD1293745.1 hypothetical protein [Methanocella sp. CWC-04]
MLEIFCDSSFNEKGPSFIGCVVMKDCMEVHQSTTRIVPDPASNLDSELSAIGLALSIAKIFSNGNELTMIYNDSTEAVKEYIGKDTGNIIIDYRSRDDVHQSVADRLSKKFQQSRVETFDLCKKPVESFTPEILKDIAQNKRTVVFLEKDPVETTNTKTCYVLFIRNIDGTLSKDRRYYARSGEVKNIKVANDISADLTDPGVLDGLESKRVDLDGSYFLLTDETWGLRIKGGESYSILPCGIDHRIICHEVDRTPKNLFDRAAIFLKE